MKRDAALVPAAPAPREAAGEAAIRPFRAQVPDADLADLRRRLAATRWPGKELVEDRSQGVQLATLLDGRARVGLAKIQSRPVRDTTQGRVT